MMIRWALALMMLVTALPARAQPVRGPLMAWNPSADYVTAGQDEPGYATWLAAQSYRPMFIRGFENFLMNQGLSGIVPTWQLLRTATDWQKCSAQPFEVPPPNEWVNLVETLKYIRAHVIPVIGPVEPVSVYRNPALNACAGGAAESAHRQLFAIDLVPLKPTGREDMIRGLCAIHAWRGTGFDVGMGFYKGLRFHVDSKKFRKWGTDGSGSALACTDVLADLNAQAAANRVPIVAIPIAMEPPAPAPAPAPVNPPIP